MLRLKPPYWTAFIVIIFAFVGRAAFLEYTDLIDPTESRYAVVASEMVATDNWLTPQLPMPEGMTPYLGKPPLHFWLTSLSYELFGVDEWTARLPSLLSSLGILFAIWFFSIHNFGKPTAVSACLIYISSGMAFFLAGASVTDVTFTFTVTASVTALYLYLLKPSSSLIRISAIAAALSFLTKGPVSLVLIWFPILLWSLARKDFGWIKKFPWFTAGVYFVAITIPWFILCEIKNPGFTEYFFWNENLARYLFKEYGDRYGSGHVQPYGASWVMLLGAFFPWTFLLLAIAWKNGFSELKNFVKSKPHLLFLGCWAIATPLFFTFVRQLHMMYVLPAVPPFSILTAYLLMEKLPKLSGFTKFVSSKNLSLSFVAIGLILAFVGACLEFSMWPMLLSLAIIIAGFLTFKFRYQNELPLICVTHFSFFLIALYLIGISSITPFLNLTRSSENVLQAIAKSANCSNIEPLHSVGVSSSNAFSSYWIAQAWTKELDKEVKISYVAPENAASSKVCHYMMKAKKVTDVPKTLTDSYRLLMQSGDWLVYARN